MAIYINGTKVAGRGMNGASPYQIAQAGGYTGTEEEFNQALIAIGETRQGFDIFLTQIENEKTELEQTINNFNTNIENMATKEYVDNTVDNAIAQIITDVFYYGSEAPENTKLLWIDSNEGGVLRYYNTVDNNWIHVPVAWS